jgi:osmotically-inducible protein OsmY
MRIILTVALFAAFLAGCRTNQSPQGQLNDLKIATQLRTKLASDMGPSTLANISVNSTNGVVTLAGQVDTANAKAQAETEARGIPNVVRVVNNLQVTPKPQA